MLKKALLALVAVAMFAGTAFAAKNTVVTFGSDCTWPPMEFLNKDKQITGFSVDLLKAMGKAGNFTPKIENVAWDGIFAGLAMGKYEVISSSVSITEERKKTMDFSDPYFEVKQAVIVPKASSVHSTSGLKGKKVGAQIGTTGYFAAKDIAGAVPKSYDEIGLAVEDLYNGGLDAVICDDPIAANYALQNPKYAKALKIAFVIDSPKKEYLGFAVRKGEAKVLDLLNSSLAKVKASGEYDKIKAKWFGSN